MSKVTACICVMVVFLVIQVTTAQGFSRDGPAKFMRWGRKGGDDSVDTAALQLPLFGDSNIVCRSTGESNLYRCDVQ
ncbi:uncharacterized protein [Amphiura filiformis]|uniref:uncharacterized protein n=1 Tax=Amphiura filiformis TaxID=82378 RepID=UPI003B22133A